MDKFYQFLERDSIQPLILMGIRATSLVMKFVLTLFVARYMGFESLGAYGLIISLTFLIPSFTGLGIMYMKSRDSVTQSSEYIVDMLRHYGRFIVVVYAILIVASAGVGSVYGGLGFAVLVLAVILFEHINNDLYTLLLNLSKPFSANVLHGVRTSVWIFSFIAFSLLYPSFQTLPTLLLFWTAGGLFALLGFFVACKEWNWKAGGALMPFISWVKAEFKTSKTIYLNNIVDCSGQYINHYIVTILLGLELTGVYVYFSQVISAMSNLLRTSVIVTARPKLVKARKEMSSSFVSIYNKCRKNTFILSCLMSIFSIPALYFLTVQIVDKPLALEWFSVFFAYLAFFIVIMLVEVDNLVLYSYHQDERILKLSVLYLVSQGIISPVLIFFFGLWGAVLSLLIPLVVKWLQQRKYISLLKI